jgi:hypothetical protein
MPTAASTRAADTNSFVGVGGKFAVCVGFAKHCRAADVWWSITVEK